MSAKFAIFLILLCAPLSAVPEVDEASSHNALLAPSLLGAANACSAPARTSTRDDIFSVAEVRIVSLIPQAGNTTSDLASPSALWSWSVDFPPEARFSIREDERCPAGEIRYFAPSSPSLAGTISYKYGSSVESLSLLSAGENPLPLNLSAAKLLEEDFSQPFAPLSLEARASIAVSYSFSKSSYSYRCRTIGGYTACGCEQSSTFGTRAFSREVAHSRNFSVEAGPVSLLWLNPPLSSRLAGNGTGKLAIFARRLPASLLLAFREKEVAFVQPYSFSVGTGECGEKTVEREFLPQQASAGFFINTSAPLFPFQLVEKNASYVPFYLEFPWHAEAGKANFTVVFEDAFSHGQSFPREFFVREPLPFSPSSGERGNNWAMKVRAASEEASAAAYPSRVQQGGLPDFSLIAAAFAIPLAIGAAALARRLEMI